MSSTGLCVSGIRVVAAGGAALNDCFGSLAPSNDCFQTRHRIVALGPEATSALAPPGSRPATLRLIRGQFPL